jgi:hypothetical protein
MDARPAEARGRRNHAQPTLLDHRSQCGGLARSASEGISVPR